MVGERAGDGVTPLVEVSGLTHAYRGAPGPALDGISLVVPPGGIVGLVGHNGAGKTTMLRILTFLLRPDAGVVCVAGHALYHDPAETAAAKRLVGAVSDVPLLYERLTGREFVRFIGQTYGLSSGAGLEGRIATLLAYLELAEHGDRQIGSYSLGMRKKTALCAALVHDPALVVLDEPFDNLDPEARRRLKEALRELALRGGAVLLSTHGLEVAQGLCDRVVVLHHGRIRADGTLDDLRRLAGAGAAESLEDVFFRLTGPPTGDTTAPVVAPAARPTP